MSARRAIALFVNPKKSSLSALHIQCRLKPGVDKRREGVTAVSEEAIELCVAAPAQDGQANEALLKTLHEALGLPKTSMRIIRGIKSRDKLVAIRLSVSAIPKGRDIEDWPSIVRERLVEEAAANR